MNIPDYHHPVTLPPVMISEMDRDDLYAAATSALRNSRTAPAASNVLREIFRARLSLMINFQRMLWLSTHV